HSAGWTIRFANRGVTISGRLRLEPATLARAKAVFGKPSSPVQGVRTLEQDDAVLYAYASLDPAAAWKELQSPSLPGRADLDRLPGRVKEELGIDVEKDVLPLISGQGSIASGIGGLETAEVRALLEDPAHWVWSAAALGAQDPAKVQELEKRAEPT